MTITEKLFCALLEMQFEGVYPSFNEEKEMQRFNVTDLNEGVICYIDVEKHEDTYTLPDRHDRGQVKVRDCEYTFKVYGDTRLPDLDEAAKQMLEAMWLKI